MKALGLILKINFHSFCAPYLDIFDIIFLASAIGSNLYEKIVKIEISIVIYKNFLKIKIYHILIKCSKIIQNIIFLFFLSTYEAQCSLENL